ncbi:MAG: DUF1254 domain-containing protein [Bacteroidales bacterium]|nr:DUF1254 domain-containing protein [Bacteroidales bacterium]MDD2632822.1 DUF1254 domain-containing protein [Bacteroidales bacterium]MDD4177035.1 DUF1254 domain-containing protein [Bacteroidales bacterium]MDD4741856.1 DUF1254 domain-containing protein [Bacteroidales bacterium]MDY0334457.1 DUF1254 domain-containing protein [Bacteroidales bacterium]
MQLINNLKNEIVRRLKTILLVFAVLSLSSCDKSESLDATTKVTDENYALAETQVIFTDYVNRIAAKTNTNGVGVFMHVKEPLDPADRTIMRVNFDTQYSYVVLDLTEDAVLNMPETNGRYQSAWFITEEHYNPMAITEPGEYTISQEQTGSKYVMILVRTQVNMKDAADIAIVSKLQDQLKLSQNDRGTYTASFRWDMNEILAMRKKYQELAVAKGITSEMMFGKKGEVSLENHNCGTACGWGGLTKEQAVYPNYLPENTHPATLTLIDVPVDAFWSVTIYDQDGFPQGDIYNINSAFAKANNDGAVIIHFGGDENADNYMDIFEGWNFTLRLYLPTEEYFNGTWTKPELIPVD